MYFRHQLMTDMPLRLWKSNGVHGRSRPLASRRAWPTRRMSRW